MTTGDSASNEFESEPGQEVAGDASAVGPGDGDSAVAEITHCPHCKRKLLTTHSPLCSWCGEPIKDPDYLAKAAEARAAQDQALREKLSKEAEEIQKYGTWGRYRRLSKTGTGPKNPLLDIDDLKPK